MKTQMIVLAVLGAVLAALGKVSFKWGAEGRSDLLEFAIGRGRSS